MVDAVVFNYTATDHETDNYAHIWRHCSAYTVHCTKMHLAAGLHSPGPAGAACSVPTDPLTGFRGPTSKGIEPWGKGRRGQRRKGDGKREKGNEEEGGRRVLSVPYSESFPDSQRQMLVVVGRFYGDNITNVGALTFDEWEMKWSA